MTGQLTTASDAAAYITAGKATVTLVSKKTGTRFTYEIKHGSQRTDAGGFKMDTSTPLFVKVLAGPQNTDNYMYLGFIPNNNHGTLVAGRKGRPDAPSFKALSWVLQALQRDLLPEQLEVWHEGACGRCGRKLTVPKSIENGIGPECARKVHTHI